ncbi:hypothetical protein DENIS_2674 [Desulfonema ishimotonii]|uniref:histidine kinase n=1 Tax=Desulfonema ishimotonii TaxID=45657 RepID=A0A401FXI0_9BACT|nr:PAS domain S-box protein [Desulfonema ishimotonii]GBC61712.1 hypothetical protein DENIS_2674 [Desulfonema ishimotonii]
MRIQTKINVFSVSVLILMTASIVLAGVCIINRIVYDMGQKLLTLELRDVIDTIDDYYQKEQALKKTAGPDAEKNLRNEMMAVLKAYRHGKTGHLCLISEDRKIVLHRDAEAGTDAQFGFVDAMLRQRSGVTEYVYRGEKRFCAFNQFAPLNWLVGLSVSTDELFKKRTLYIYVVLSIAALFLVAVIAMTGFLSKTDIRRILDTLVCLKKFERGELEIRIESIAADDEIGAIQAGINSMAAKREQDEKELRDAQQLLRDIIEFLPDATFVVDQDRKVIAWNQAMEDMTGVRKWEIIGKGDYEYSIPFYGKKRPILIDLFWEDSDAVKAKYDSFERRRDVIYAEVFAPKVYGGEGAFVWATASPLLDASGNTVGAIESVRNVSDLRNALDNLKLTQFSVDNSADGAFWIGPDARLIYVNASACKLLGYTREELLALPVYDLDTSFAEASWPKQWQQMKSRDGVVMESFQCRKDGACFPVEITGRYMEFGGKEYVFAFARDITARRQAEAELRKYREHLEQLVAERTAELQAANQTLQESLENLKKAQDQLVQSEKMAALGGLVAGVAHEINTPVGVSVTAASFLEEKTRKLSENYKAGQMKRSDLDKYLMTVSEATSSLLTNLNRAADLIKSFKQVAVDQSSEKRRTFTLKTYIDEVLLSLRPNYKRTRHSIRVSCPEDLELDSYPGAFSQIITNLVMNSLVHGFEGIEAGEIVIDISTEAENLRFSYSDNGIGVEVENIQQIFAPFFTTKRSYGGTGLGLHVVYNLVTQTLGGQIECASTPGSGTEFLINLPLSPDVPEM